DHGAVLGRVNARDRRLGGFVDGRRRLRAEHAAIRVGIRSAGRLPHLGLALLRALPEARDLFFFFRDVELIRAGHDGKDNAAGAPRFAGSWTEGRGSGRGASAAGCATGLALLPFDSAADCASALVIRPPRPVPVTSAAAIFCSAIILRAAGSAVAAAGALAGAGGGAARDGREVDAEAGADAPDGREVDA